MKSSLHDILISSRFGCDSAKAIFSLFLIAKLLERMVTGWITQHSIAMQNVAFVTTLRCNWSYACGLFDVTACDQHVSSLSDLAISDEIYSMFLRSTCALIITNPTIPDQMVERFQSLWNALIFSPFIFIWTHFVVNFSSMISTPKIPSEMEVAPPPGFMGLRSKKCERVMD